MRKTLITALLAAGTVFAALPAAAQAPAGQSKKDLVARLVQLQQPGIEQMARGLAEQPAMAVMQQAGQALQRVAADRREAMARDIEADVRQYAESAVPIVRDKAMKAAPQTIGTILDERLTEEELRQIIAALENPAVRKFQGMNADMQRALTEKTVADSKADIEPKVRAMQQTVAKRLGITPQPAGSAPAAGGAKKP